jgi:hypothetical protein
MSSAEPKKKARSTNLELLRILSMLLIVFHHYTVNSPVMQLALVNTAGATVRPWFYILAAAWGKTAINCFVLITGYFMCTSRLTPKKFLLLLSEFVFYKLIFYFVFVGMGYEAFGISKLLKAIFPIYYLNDSFIPAFFLLYLSIPFLNALLKALSQRSHFCLMALGFFVYTVLGTSRHVTVVFNYFSWFVVIYIIAAYLRLYPDSFVLFSKHITLKMILFIAMGVLSIWLGKLRSNDFKEVYYYVSDSNKILALMISVFVFLFFKNLKFPYVKFINTVARSMFGVLLIHANSDAMRQWLWYDTLKNAEYYTMYNSKITYIHSIGCTLAVFAICIIIDQIRINLLERPLFSLWDKKEAAVSDWMKRAANRMSEFIGI